jgi:2,3-bisphosphoglycerate-independent phosphoglycerate mutase
MEAVETLRREAPGIIDQDLPPFVIVDDVCAPIGAIQDGDAVVFWNFRGDRAIEISRAFTDENFDRFDRGRLPEVLYAGMMEYDGDLNMPPLYLVNPPAIARTVSEYLVHNGVSQLAVAETQKFGHVTYFWNGNNSQPFDVGLEDWVEVPSDDIPFDLAPEMKAQEVAEVVLADLESRGHRFIRVNFANGDMVGHTGSLDAAIRAMEVVDRCMGEIEERVRETGATMIVTADHGNLDMMWEVDSKTSALKRDAAGKPMMKTSHTLSPVPWCVVGADASRFVANGNLAEPGLGNIAATILLLLGYQAPSDYLPALLVPKGGRF